MIKQKIFQDGQYYDSPDDVPYMGSIVGTAIGGGNCRSYRGLYSDKHLLPHYANLATGSTAILADPILGMVYFFYEHTTDQWIEIG